MWKNGSTKTETEASQIYICSDNINSSSDGVFFICETVFLSTLCVIIKEQTLAWEL